MPASSKKINVQHGSNAHPRRIRRQTTRSTDPEKRPGTERRGSKSEGMKMTNGTSAGNRFAALSHTKPAPGVNMERGMHPTQPDFTFHHEKPFSPAAGIISASEAGQPSNTEADGSMLASQPVAPRSTNERPIPDPSPSRVTELKAPVSVRDFGHTRIPTDPLPQTASELSTFLPRSSLHVSPPAILTESSSPEPISPPPTSSPQLLQSQVEILHPSLPSPTPLTTDSPLKPRRRPTAKRPKVQLPPPANATPTSLTTPLRTFYPDSDPLAQTVESPEGMIFAMAAEIAAAIYTDKLKSTPEHAQRFGPKRAPISRIHSSRGRKESSVDAASEVDSDGEWEWIG